MSRGGKDTPAAGGQGGACPSIESLETLLRDNAAQPSEALALHLRACSKCRELLEEMRSANRFLERFNSGDGRAPSHHEGTSDAASQRVVRIHGYEIEKLLAFGGQGTVYKARQKATGRDVAIKVPIGDTQRRPSTRYRFQREIELTARLDHPGIVRVFGDCELDDGRIGCVMEYVEGQPFDRWAAGQRAAGRAGTRRIVEVMSLVADAIAYAHQRAVMHRDIKPTNVVVTAEGSPRVLDFGLAKALDDSRKSFATVTGAFVGTLVYAAPEQIGEGRDASDLRTDVYALGLLLFQALTGRLPFATDAPTTEILEHIRQVSPPRPSSICSDVGDDLDAIILKALSKEKDRRYASGAEMRDDLLAWLDGRAVRARFDSRWYVVRKAVLRHRWKIAGLLAGVALLAGLGALALAARAQAARVRLADAVRDARILESHWVHLAEARSSGLDNLEAGERVAWDALLDPEQILVDSGIEGSGKGGSLSTTSPAYWALWEIYLRSPVVFSVPSIDMPQIRFDPKTNDVIAVDWKKSQLQWWDWRAGTIVRTLNVPLPAAHASLAWSSDADLVAAGSRDEPVVIIDTRRGTSRILAGVTCESLGGIRNDRLVDCAKTEGGSLEVQLWDLSASSPVLVARLPISERPSTVRFDASGQCAAVATQGGTLFILDTKTGETLLRRSPEDRPRFTSAQPAGKDREFILIGPEQIALLDLSGRQDDLVIMPKNGLADGARLIVNAAESNRFACITDRWRVGIGDWTRPLSEGRFLRAVSARTLGLSGDGRYTTLNLRPSERAGLLDLDATAVRRLPFPAPVTPSGFATVFALGFTPDSRSLVVGAMDGSIRSFEPGSGAPRVLTPESIPGGVTTIFLAGEDVYAGTHELGLGNARIVRLRDGRIDTLLAGGEQWFCGLQAESGRAIWALTGEGHLLMLDPETGERLRETRLPRDSKSYTFHALARMPQHGLLLAGPAGEGIEILDERTLEPAAPSVYAPPYREFTVSPTDPDLLATAGEDGMIRLWRLKPGPSPTLAQVSAFGSHAGAIFTIAFSPDGRLLATGGGTPETKDVRIWDVAHGQELAALDLFEMGVFDLAFSPDGRWLAAGGEVRFEHPEEGGQLYLIDLRAPTQCIAGNLEYQITRFEAEHGHEPGQAAALRAWAGRVREVAPTGR